MNKLNLKFDVVKMDTQLAEAFLIENETLLNAFAEEKYFIDYFYKLIRKVKPESSALGLEEKWKLLLNKVEENAELFAQLEALQNGVPKEETKNYTVALLVHYLKYVLEFKLILGSPNLIVMVINGLINGPFSAKSRGSALGSVVLFTKLWAEVGINHTDSRGAPYDLLDYLHSFSKIKWDSIGVVAERSDLDSAVDILLNSTTKLRCRLRHLLIQESVYDRFKKTVAWKCNLANSPSGDDATNVDKLSILCSEAHVYNEKLLLFDYAGDSNEIEDARQVIFVEAYRTVKELISLVAKHEPFALSLWASDTSEAQEIPQLLSVPVVWVNDFGRCDGPLKASAAFYNKIESFMYLDKSNKKVIKSYEAWLKLSIDNRKARLQKAFQNIKSGANKGIDQKVLDELETALQCVTSNQFVEIKNGRMCVGIQETAGLFYLDLCGGRQLQEIIKGVVNGSGIIWTISGPIGLQIDSSTLFLRLESEGLPFYELKKLNTKFFGTGYKVHLNNLYKTRVVYTNFGTVFAN